MSETQEKCVICLEKLSGDIRTIPCNHKFHTHCYATWSGRSRTNTTSCPCCRAEHEDPIRTPVREIPSFTPRVNLRNRRHNHNIRFYSHVEPVDHYSNNNHTFTNELADQIMSGEIFGHNREPNIQEIIILTIVLLFICVFLYSLMTVHTTCICNVRWEPGETHRVEKYFFGGETTFNRPDICTYIC